jgi:flagellin
VTVINTNVSATLASNAIARNERAMSTAMERLSTGKRINSAGDDAAGLAISARMGSQVKGLEQAARNAADGISMVQTIEGAGKEILNVLTRMKELAVQASTGTLSLEDRDALDAEYSQLESEITRIATNTKWNTRALMSAATTVNVQVGDASGQTMAINFSSWQLADNGGGAYGAANVAAATRSLTDAGDVLATSQTNAQNTITQLDTAIKAASSELAKYGAYINRLEYAQDNLLNVAQNTDASRSRIEDADYASETSELAKTQIISQAGTAMLAQANQIKQTVLALLQ